MARDNISVLIGQNESGKTSVLEGLYSFFTGKISEDIIRSDLSMPEIICSYNLQNISIEDIIDFNRIPEDAIPIFKELNTISILRTWDELYNSKISLEEPSVKIFFENKRAEKQTLISNIHSKLKQIINEYETQQEEQRQIINKKSGLQTDIEHLKSELKSQNKTASKTRKEKIKTEAEERIKELNSLIQNYEDELQKTEENLNQLSKVFNEKKTIIQIAQKVEEIHSEYKTIEQELQEKYQELKEMEATFHLLNTPKEKRSNEYKLEDIKASYLNTSEKLNVKRKDYEYWLQVAEKVFQDIDIETAKNEIKELIKHEENQYDLETLGNLIFDNSPLFEFFQDFSSLLPDKIDLEDIIFRKENVKGYKAVRNYLEIANLKPEFFDQKNSRILKQKIEKLNKEITVDFHEYWRQTIGTKNKIQISFELEHYDHNTPDKLGKPYIEFWIKDKDERLYPKQRSRGVRWFLSFYLELKAFAKHQRRNRILLIDEPAMSLHARAQEDVLKVFEDIKEDLQIIYTTHSPHLVDRNKLYRILALQRTDRDDYSETKVFSANSFKYASSDTLSPIYSLMGARLNNQNFIQSENNIILEDIATYYYFTAIKKIAGLRNNLYFLPAADASHVVTLANLLLGWKLGFIVVLSHNQQGIDIYNYFKHHLFRENENLTKQNIVLLHKDQKQIEDIFSTLDFKKFILNQRVGITESNSDYIKNNNLSRSILASDFLSLVDNKNLSLEEFDDQTQENIDALFSNLKKSLEKPLMAEYIK
jgi:predicted ATP-dependent endonuclease of OLD family